MAASFDSAPVVSSRTLLSGAGNVAASVLASSTSGTLSIPLYRWSRVATAVDTVDTMSGCECPRMELICPEVKSRIAVPSSS